MGNFEKIKNKQALVRQNNNTTSKIKKQMTMINQKKRSVIILKQS